MFCTGGLKFRVRSISAMLKRLEKLVISMLVFALRVETMPRKLFLVLVAGNAWCEGNSEGTDYASLSESGPTSTFRERTLAKVLGCTKLLGLLLAISVCCLLNCVSEWEVRTKTNIVVVASSVEKYGVRIKI